MSKLLVEIELEILQKYKKEGITFRYTEEDHAFCYVFGKLIYLRKQTFFEPTVNTIFDLLHEIGHIKTNTLNMTSCEEEYHATVWAIKELKKYKLKLPKIRKDAYQRHIYYWRDQDIKTNKLNIPNKEQLIIKW